MDAETWRVFLEKEVADGGTIRDEYHQEYSVPGFFEEVEQQRGQRRQSVHYPDAGVQDAGPDVVSFSEWE